MPPNYGDNTLLQTRRLGTPRQRQTCEEPAVEAPTPPRKQPSTCRARVRLLSPGLWLPRLFLMGEMGRIPKETTTWTLLSPRRRAGVSGIFVVSAGAFAGLCQVRPAAQRPCTSRSMTLTGRHGCAYGATHSCTNQNKIQTFGFLFPGARWCQ